MARWEKPPPKESWGNLNWRNRPSNNAFTGDTVFIDDEAGPYLRSLAGRFPEEYPRALRNAAWELRHEILRAMRRGTTPDGKLDQISKMHMYHRMELLKQGIGTDDGWKNGARFRLKKKLGYRKARGTERLMDRWRGDTRKGNIRNELPMQGKILRTITTKAKGKLVFWVGAQNPVAMRWLEAAQGGRRGSRGVFQYLGQQPITPAMRRAFWAAGIPLRKDKTHIEQPERSVLTPVYRAFSKKLPEIMDARVKAILHGLTGKKNGQ